MSLIATSDDYINETYKPGVFKVTITGTAGSLTQTAVIEFTLSDPCDPPLSITVASLVDQTYRLADMSAAPYTHADFTVVPDYCPLKYTYSETSLTDSDGNSETAISRTDKTFTFSYDKDDAPVSPVAQTQTVTITATSDSKYPTSFPKKSDSASFDLDFTDPCQSSATSSVTVTP